MVTGGWQVVSGYRDNCGLEVGRSASARKRKEKEDTGGRGGIINKK